MFTQHGSDTLEDTGVGGRIIGLMIARRVVSSGSGKGQVSGCCEHSYEPLGGAGLDSSGYGYGPVLRCCLRGNECLGLT
jgi:hypothetical protein